MRSQRYSSNLVGIKRRNMFKEIDFKDLGERCIATFLETFLAMITAQAMTGGDNDLLQSAFVGGLASVLALLKTVVKNYNVKK